MRVVLLALLVAIHLPAVAAAQPGDAARLVLLLRNEADAARLDLTVTDVETGRVVAERSFDAPARADHRERVPLPQGRYEVYVRHALGGPGPFGPSEVHATRGCDGDYVVAYRWDGRAFMPMGDATGCIAGPPEALALLEEARAARASLSPGRGVVVPLPGLGDEGVLRQWLDLDPPRWEGARASAFAWTPNASFVDDWGRLVPGAEVEYATGGGWCGGGVTSTSGQSVVATATTDGASIVRYEAGTPTVLAMGGPGCSSTVLPAGAPGVTSPTHVTTGLAYRAASPLACVFRHGAQGATLHARAMAPAACGEGEWFTGARGEHRGLAALPLYGLHEDAAGVRVVRMWLADGVAYPLDLDVWRVSHAEGARHYAARVEAVRPGGAPLDVGETLPPRAAPLAPLDALRGPAGAGGLALPLAQASDAARADASLTELQALLARGDAALVLARYAVRSEPGSPLLVDEWRLLFTAKGASPVPVDCSRPRAPAPVPVRCARPPGGHGFVDVPDVGARDLPALAPSFDEALARWRAGAEGEATFASYRAGGAEARPHLALGRGFPQSSAPLPPAQSEDAEWVVLDLASGATRALVLGSARQARTTVETGIVPIAVGEAAAPAPAPGADAPRGIALVATGAVALGVLALLAWAALAMYTRLTRSAVVAAPARAAILDVVRDEPGIHASGVMDRLGKAHGVAEYHLAVLVREGFLTVVDAPGFKRYFVTGRFSHQEMRALAALRDGQNEKLFRIIEANPGIHLSDLAARAGVALPHASRTVKSLVAAGLVDKVQVGRAVALHAIER